MIAFLIRHKCCDKEIVGVAESKLAAQLYIEFCYAQGKSRHEYEVIPYAIIDETVAAAQLNNLRRRQEILDRLTAEEKRILGL